MFVQDWLTLKVVELPDNDFLKLKTGDKIVYEKDNKKYVATYIGYYCKPDFQASFLYKLNEKQLERFYQLDKKAKEIFEAAKPHLKFIFPQLQFLTAKMDFSGNIIYIYFYGEDRIDFREWLKDIRNLLGINFFLFQVGARDRIRLHPQAKNWLGDCGHSLCCTKTLCKLESITTETISLQNLQTQGTDRQKGLCGKLKCCLKYEADLYEKELKKYPAVGTNIEKDGKKYTVIGINVLSKYIFLKNEEGYIEKVKFDQDNDKQVNI